MGVVSILCCVADLLNMLLNSISQLQFTNIDGFMLLDGNNENSRKNSDLVRRTEESDVDGLV